jgi:hypothetical protein
MGLAKNQAQEAKDKRRSKPKGGQSERLAWRGFVNVELTEGQMESIPDVAESIGTYTDCIARLTEDGFKVTFTLDRAHSCWIASATGTEQATSNERGWTVSGRGGDVARSLEALLYKVYVVLSEVVWEDYAREAPTLINYG